MKQEADATRPSRGYLPTLDGWRTLSIAAVICCHDRLHSFGPIDTTWLYLHGNLGVDIFFAISGLLICSRLLDEERETGSISIPNFYLRRAFRILPPAVAYLATLAILLWLIHLPVGLPEIFASAFFVRNYTFFFQHFQTVSPFYTSHFWLFAVEEQRPAIRAGHRLVSALAFESRPSDSSRTKLETGFARETHSNGFCTLALQ